MEDKEKELFEKYEKETNHSKLLKLTEYIAKTGWVLIFSALLIIYFENESSIGYLVLMTGLGVLAASIFVGIRAEKLRKEIVVKVESAQD